MKYSVKQRVSAVVLALALAGSISGMALADFRFPSAYWPLQEQWEEAIGNSDVDRVLEIAPKVYDLLYPYGIQQTVCEVLEPTCGYASWCSEIKGDLDGALVWMGRQEELAVWMDENMHSYKDTLLSIQYRRRYLETAQSPAIYALTDQAGRDYTAAGAARMGTLYGSAVGGLPTDASSVLLYVTFADGHSMEYWLGNYKNNEIVNRALQGGILELAWNFSSENTAGAEQVLSSEDYINESLATLGALDATVLLRVGAEMNNWADLNKDTYIQAFQKVAAAARQYPNIKMVFSPDEISNRNVTFQDFYPGDEYVDWIGVSIYQRTNYTAYNTADKGSYTFSYGNYGVDAYYGTGIYDADPLVSLRGLADFAAAHGKPMMISECGFAHTHNGVDQTSYAMEQMNKFYGYVNMIYPQVKAVFYFDANVGEAFDYDLQGNSTLFSNYQSVIAANGGFINKGETSGKTWQLLGEADNQAGPLKLAAYAILPGTEPTTVKYSINGTEVFSSSSAPYYYELNPATLDSGTYTMKATASNGRFTVSTPETEFTVMGDMVTAKGAVDVSGASGWAQSVVLDAYSKKLLTPTTSGGFQAQITRLQFAELAVNMIEQATGTAIPPSGTEFSDTSDTAALKAAAAGVTNGKGEGIFKPQDLITRQEICTMLKRAAGYVEQAKGISAFSNTDTAVNPKFTDSGNIDSWAVEGMALMTNNGIMGGVTETELAPKDNTTVEQAIALASRLYSLLAAQ